MAPVHSQPQNPNPNAPSSSSSSAKMIKRIIFFGATGAGKSTLINAIHNYLMYHNLKDVPREIYNKMPIIQRPFKQLQTLNSSIKLGDLCFTIVTPEKFPGLSPNYFHPFLLIMRNVNSQGIDPKMPNLLFVPNGAEADFTAVMQVLSRGPKPLEASRMLTIGIRDIADFMELLEKCEISTCGDPKSGTAADWSPDADLSTDDIEQKGGSWSWIYYRGTIKPAQKKIPKQTGRIECAANSAARFLIMCGSSAPGLKSYGLKSSGIWETNYSSFSSNCPKDSDTYAERTKNTSLVATGIGILLAPFVPPLGAAIAFGGVETAFAAGAVESIHSGPSPWSLSNYIDTYLFNSIYKHSFVRTYSCFADCADAISRGIDTIDPVIVFLLWGPTSWHYANVVGVNKGSNGKVEGFLLLETDQSFEYRSYENLRHVMYNSYSFNTTFCLGGTPNNYTIIQAVRR